MAVSRNVQILARILQKCFGKVSALFTGPAKIFYGMSFSEMLFSRMYLLCG